MEKYIGHFGPVSGHTYDTLYDLIFTTHRMIAANTCHPTDTSYCFRASDLLIGRGLANKGEKALRLAQSKGHVAINYADENLDELIEKRRFNFAVPLENISFFDIKKGLFKAKLQCRIITTSGDTKILKFQIAQKKCPEFEALIQKLLPERVQYHPRQVSFSKSEK